MKSTLTHLFGALAASTLLGALTPACAVATEGSPAAEPTETGKDASDLFGLGSPTCPTAKDFAPGESPSLWYWRTRRETSIDVFASDGQEVAGVERVYEVMKSWDPLDGRGITTRRPCHRAFVQRLDGTGRRFVDAKPVLGGARVTAYMRPRGYATLEITPQDAKGATEQVRLDTGSGARRVLASQAASACAAISQAFPSPTGDRIALVTAQTTCGSTPAPWTATVSLLDAAGAKVVGPSVRGFAGRPEGTFRRDGALVVTDLAEAVTFDASGTFSVAPVPGCVAPKTTSSHVDADGRQIDAVGPDGAVILGTPTDEKFGCQG